MEVHVARRVTARSRAWTLALAVAVCGAFAPASAHARTDTRCIVASGGAASRCVKKYAQALVACRVAANAACEPALRAPGGPLAMLLAATEQPVREGCPPAAADVLTSSLGVDDLVSHTAQACAKWGDDFAGTVVAADLAGAAPATLACQRVVADRLARVRDRVVRAYGRRCDVAEFAGRRCDRAARDRRIAHARADAQKAIVYHCGTAFDALGLVSSAAGALLEDRVDALEGTVVDRARHLAQRVYPPFSLGPTAFFGPYPVGVRTLDLVDPSRPNPVGPGFRPLTTEVYYPSTPDAVAGVPRDVLQIVGIDLFPTPTYRDVARAPGTFPLIVYAHSGGSIRFDNALKMAHLASHGFVIVAPERPGNDLLSASTDPGLYENGPRELSFVIDEVIGFNGAPGHFLEGGIDPARIGATGHSFGGYALTALATGPFFRGTFTDPRVKAILPLDAALGAQHWGADAPAIFSTITIPTLSIGGDSLFSATLAPDHQAMFDALQPGPSVVAYAVLRETDHLTALDDCEVPDALLAALGGIQPACQPGLLPWRYARHIIDYLALNFFDGVLNGNPDALARLDPARLATIEELGWQTK